MTFEHDDPFSPQPPAAPSPGPGPGPSDLPPPPVPAVPAASPESPTTVYWGSYLFVGVAAVLAATAIAALIGLADFRSRHSASGPVLVAVAVAAVVVAAIVVGLGVLDERGHRWARTMTWLVCGLAACAAVAVLIVEPGSSVTWFAQLARLGAAATVVVAVASAVLLALPASNAYFTRPATPQPAWTPSPPLAGTHPPSAGMPAEEPDHDPFS